MPAMAGDTPDYIPAATPSTVSQKPSDTVTVAEDGMGSKHTWGVPASPPASPPTPWTIACQCVAASRPCAARTPTRGH